MYVKDGPARYLSHLDLVRAFEQAARRAGLPLAHTQGFNPHPKMSFAAPLPVGVAGEAEFADIELTHPVGPLELAEKLNKSLSEGLKVREVRPLPPVYPSLMSVVQKASYSISAGVKRPIEQAEVDEAINAFLSKANIFIEREGKKTKNKSIDIRPGIYALCGRVKTGEIVIEAVLRTGSAGNVRVDDLLSALVKYSGLPLAPPFACRRTGLYRAGGTENELLWPERGEGKINNAERDNC